MRTQLAIVLTLSVASCSLAESGNDNAFDVWVLDQSDSPDRTYGGTIYVYGGEQLAGPDAATAQPRLRIDLGGATADLCQSRTGAPPVRPHMIRFNQEHTHAILAFVASGHVVFMDATTGAPIDCLRATQSATGQQAHAAYPTADDRFVLIANQNGKRLERISTDYQTNTFVRDTAALLDLTTCITPGGAPCQSPDARPDNAPICPWISQEGLAFVTLRGGGLLVVDVRDTPMRIVAEYDVSHVKGNGCGAVEVNDYMYVNAGGRPGKLEHMSLYGFDVYRFPLLGLADPTAVLAPNTPAPNVVWSEEGAHDAHGMVATPDGRYVWVFDRHGDAAEIIDTRSARHVGTVSLNGELTTNAAPDIAAMAPAGDRIFVALRGPVPLSGDPHNAIGDTPGLGVVELSDGGRSGRLAAIVRIANPRAGAEHADPHAVAIRRRP